MSWVESATTMVGALGGAVGAAGGLAVLASRKKIKAEAADVLTDTALTLLEPLKVRVHELESEVKTTRDNMIELSDSVSSLTSILRRWRSAILAPDARVDRLRQMVTTDHVTTGGRD